VYVRSNPADFDLGRWRDRNALSQRGTRCATCQLGAVRVHGPHPCGKMGLLQAASVAGRLLPGHGERAWFCFVNFQIGTAGLHRAGRQAMQNRARSAKERSVSFGASDCGTL